MADIEDILEQMKRNPKGIRFNDLSKVCAYFFGEPRQSGSSHKVIKCLKSHGKVTPSKYSEG